MEREKLVYLYAVLERTSFSFLSFALPLYLLSEGFSLSGIGLLLAILPLAFLLVRVALSFVADWAGTGRIFLLSGALRLLAGLSYVFPPAVLTLSFGKVSEGAGSAAFWSVSRKVLYEKGQEEGRKGALLSGLAQVGNFLGVLVAGVSIFYLGFSVSLWIPVLIGAALLVVAVLISREEKESYVRSAKLPKVGKLSDGFWRASLVLCLSSVFDGLLFSAALPAFLTDRIRLSYFESGGLLAIYQILSAGASLYLVRRWKNGRFLPSARATLAMVLSSGIALLLLGCLANFLGALLFVLTMSVSNGIKTRYWEELISAGVRSEPVLSKRSPAFAITLVQAPLQVASIAAVGGAGFVVERFGFGFLFLLAFLSHLGFSLLSKRVLWNKRANA